MGTQKNSLPYAVKDMMLFIIKMVFLYYSYTDEWFVSDDKHMYSIEDVKVSKNDIE